MARICELYDKRVQFKFGNNEKTKLYPLTVMLFVPLCGFASVYSDVNHDGEVKSSSYILHKFTFFIAYCKIGSNFAN